MLGKFLNSDNGKVLNKFLAMILVMTLTFANFLFLGVSLGEGLVSYAKDEEESKIEAIQKFKTNKVLKIGDEFKRFVQLEITTKISNGTGAGKLSIPGTVVDKKEPEEIKVTSYTSKFEFENNNIKFNASETDKFIVTYIYNEEVAFDNETKKAIYDEQELKSEKITVQVTLNDNDKIIDESCDKIENSEKKQFGDIVTIEKNTSNIFKGNMYLNKETEYSEIIKAEFSLINKDVINKNINISEEDDIQTKTIVKDEEVFESSDATINYKSTTFSKAQLEKMFSGDENAYVLVTSVADEVETKTIIVFGNVDEKEYENYKIIDITKIDNNEKEVKIDYAENTTDVKFETTIPTTEGIIKIKNDKEIILSEKENVEKITKLNSKIELSSEKYTVNASYENDIKEPMTTSNLTMEFANTNQTLLSSLIENQVKFTVNLMSNGPANKLFKNPTFKIDIPSNININQITDYSLAINDGLTIKKIATSNNSIVVELEGEQADYNYDEIQQSISIGAILSVDRTTPSGEVNLEFSCVNDEEEVKLDPVTVNVYSPTELISLTNITVDETTTSIEENNTNKIARFADKKTANINVELVNNYNGDLKNVVINGVLADKESTLTTNLIKELNVSGLDYTIKYLNKSNEVCEATSANSFEIVINEMKHGEELKLAYGLSVAENLPYNESIVNTLKASFTYEGKECTKDLSMNITTGIGPCAKIEVTPMVENKVLNPGQIVTYNIQVENNGDEDINTAKLSYEVTKNGEIIDIQNTDSDITYTSDDDNIKEFFINGLTAGEKVNTEVSVKVNEINENETLISEAILTANDEVIANKEVKNNIELSNLELTLCNYMSATENIEGEYQYLIKTKNISNSNIKNISIKMNVPENLSINENKLLVDGTEKYKFNNTNKEIICNIDEIVAQEEIEIIVTLDVDKVLPEENNHELKVQVYATVEANGCNKVQSNIISNIYYTDDLQIKLTSDSNVNLKAYEDVNYTVTVNNKGKKMAVADVEDIIPEEISVNRVTYSVNNGTENVKYINGSELDVICLVGAGETLNINYTGTVKAVDEDTTINHIAKINLGNDNYIESDVITNVVAKEDITENFGENNTDDNKEKSADKSLSIIGTVWLDENANGKKESSEKTLDGVGVNLINAKTGELIKNNAGEIITVTTGDDGVYKFTDLKAGEYKVIFKYDTSKYQPTQFNAEGIAESVNSDATSQTVNMNGEKQTVALTETIKLSENSQVNVDLGLVENNYFDLSLTKQIKKVTVKNDEGTSEYDFTNTNTSKVEIPGKYYKGSTLVIEYDITVKNEGDVTAYVTDILDYMPKELSFNSEMNTNWYVDANGVLHNIAISMDELEPGKSITETVILTKTIDNDNAITITNEAEIGSSTNTEGLTEKDSTAGNKSANEDDYSKAELIVSIKTGGAFVYIGITLISLIILSAGIYIINKKVLKGDM